MLPVRYFIDDKYFDSAPENIAFREGQRVALNMLAEALGITADHTGGVVGGLAVAAVSGSMKSSVAVGVALYRDASTYTETIDGDETLSDLGLMYLEHDPLLAAGLAVEVTHDAAPATPGESRIDLVVISSVVDDVISKDGYNYGGGAAPNTPLVRGVTTIVSIVKGTAGVSPAAPSAADNQLVLAQVLIEHGDADFANFTYTDVREFVAGPRYRKAQPLVFHEDEGTDVPVAQVEDRTGVNSNPQVLGIKHGHNGGAGPYTGFPYFFRNFGDVDGQLEGELLFMLTRSRAWQETKGFANAVLQGATPTNTTVVQGGTTVAGVGGILLTHVPSGAETMYIDLELQTPGRGIAINGTGVIEYDVVAALDGTDTFHVRVLHYDAATRTMSPIASQALTKTAGGGTSHQTDVAIADTELAEGDFLVVRVHLAWGASATAGSVRLIRFTWPWDEYRSA